MMVGVCEGGEIVMVGVVRVRGSEVGEVVMVGVVR